MTSPGPEAVRAIAAETYSRISPTLGCHSPCRIFASITAGICTALDMDYTMEFDRHYTEDGVTTQHYWVRFSSGERLDLWAPSRKVRLIEREPAGEDVAL